MKPARTAGLTAAALVGFAANSLLCRAALETGTIDAASFTSVRLLAGALVLGALARLGTPAGETRGGSWISAAALFAYAAGFSFSYLRLGAGIGALILFGTVQSTMIGWGLRGGERPRPSQWLGLAIALAGLAVIVRTGRGAPDPMGTVLMVVAGVAWGVYSLRGRAVTRPLAATADNFLRTVPFAVVLSVVSIGNLRVEPRGILLAASSGALASGVGYAFWYAALPGLSRTRAATVQLLAPAMAAAGGVLLLGEEPGPRLVAGGACILAGVALAVR